MGLLDKLHSLLQSKRLDVPARFELLKEAISGTMSNFYMARDRHTNKVVGLKIADREKLQAFEARFKGLQKPPEGDIAVKMVHDRIVQTFEHGITVDGLRYIVMEYLDGPGMHTLVKMQDERLEGKRVNLIRQMAEALSYVHHAGYIHRDVCPRNFIAAKDLNSLKLIDFGLTVPATKDFMQPGNRTGTPLYMAPEVVRRRWTDQRLDIFALGVSAYYITTFHLPWNVSETSGKAALAHDTDPPTDILIYRPTLDHRFAKAVMQCIEPNPDKRPQTIDEFLQMIRMVERDDES